MLIQQLTLMNKYCFRNYYRVRVQVRQNQGHNQKVRINFSNRELLDPSRLKEINENININIK